MFRRRDGRARRCLRLLPTTARDFAQRFDPGAVTAANWPLFAGVLTMATFELWKTGSRYQDGSQRKAFLPFLFEVSLSLCANTTAAPELSSCFLAQELSSKGR